jgi:hypothetical protein
MGLHTDLLSRFKHSAHIRNQVGDWTTVIQCRLRSQRPPVGERHARAVSGGPQPVDRGQRRTLPRPGRTRTSAPNVAGPRRHVHGGVHIRAVCSDGLLRRRRVNARRAEGRALEGDWSPPNAVPIPHRVLFVGDLPDSLGTSVRREVGELQYTFMPGAGHKGVSARWCAGSEGRATGWRAHLARGAVRGAPRSGRSVHRRVGQTGDAVH